MTLHKVLIIGGGFSGMAAAIALRKQGVAVDLVEVDAGWRSYGAGISLGGATLRAFGELGILDRFLAEGHAADGARLFTPTGQLIAELPTPRLAGPDVPGGGAIMRPVLAGILADAVRACGTTVRLGLTFSRILQDDQGVTVGFTDGTQGRYDLVIGADGLYSATRRAIFPTAPAPAYAGQAVWRAVVDRPADVDCALMWMGHKVKTGVNPVSKTQMYLFVTEDRPTNDAVDPADFPRLLADLLAGFPDPRMQTIRAGLSAASGIVYRPLEWLLLPRPWFASRVVLIGDAVHATTPHLASGACIGIEDALVLADELCRAPMDAALPAFEARRWERCRMVVENSVRLAQIEVQGGDRAEHAGIMQQSMRALAAAI